MTTFVPSHPGPSWAVRQRRRLRAALPAAIWLAAAGAVVWLLQGPGSNAITGVVDTARAAIAAQDDGRIAAVLVERHQQVSKGQLLARLDDESLRLRLRQAQQELEGLRADRKAQEAELAMEIQVKTAAHTLDSAAEHRRLLGDVETARIDALSTRADIEETRVRLAGATADAERIATLARQGLSAEAELVRLRTEQDALGRRIDELGSLHAEQVRRQQAAQQRLDAFAQGQPEPIARDAMLEPLRWRVQEQETELERLTLSARQLDLLAPFDGVVESVLLHAGEWVQSGTPVLTVVEPVPRRILAYVPTSLIAGASPAAGVTVLHPTTGVPLGTTSVVSISPAVVRVPERLWRDPRAEEWAFEVVLQATGREAPGERVALQFAP